MLKCIFFYFVFIIIKKENEKYKNVKDYCNFINYFFNNFYYNRAILWLNN